MPLALHSVYNCTLIRASIIHEESDSELEEEIRQLESEILLKKQQRLKGTSSKLPFQTSKPPFQTSYSPWKKMEPESFGDTKKLESGVPRAAKRKLYADSVDVKKV
ncbi:hypothetical protein Zmor_027972 [Zophobas morio]|uniref:Uncharacterized protein n=1 Tax=Zophobas morio TaxID=2755281 RepID=A0AA38M2J7_9CUCU|nr:hypothetical protein Zmor_027972 [Zophobas morio]